MNSNYRIIISTSSLNIEEWTDLYRFIDSIYTNSSEDAKLDALHNLKEKSIEVWYAPESNSDVYQLDGKELTDDVLVQLSKNTSYSILYQKDDDTEEFTGLAPFVFFLRKFIDENTNRSYVSLGINTDNMADQLKAGNFYFKCSNFFLYQGAKPVLGYRTLYFFSEKKRSIANLAGKRQGGEYRGNPNRRFLPLLHITENNYHSIFTPSGISENKSSEDYLYISNSLKKIKDDLKHKILKTQESKLRLIANDTDSLFSQWLINGYFYSYEPDELRNMSLDDIKGTIQTLQIYKNSIFELIQNIIFHGGKSGLFYCVFDKRENVSSYYQNKLPDFSNSTSTVNRFLRVGIYDYNQTGIVDSFKEREKKIKTKNSSESFSDLSLIDFFDTNSVATIGITQLEMRYAARLGIKSFIKAVFKHQGYFRVESNEFINGHNYKKRFGSIWNDDRPAFQQESIVDDYASGTHYEIIFPIKPYQSISTPTLQQETFFNLNQTLHSLLDSYKPIKAVNLDWNRIARINNSETKELQIEAIKSIGDDIINSTRSNQDEIAFNLNGIVVDHTLLFKVLAYIQLKANNGFRKILLINGTDDFVNDFCELISPFLSDTSDDNVPVWSNDAAIILMSKNLHVRIICGNSSEVLYALNREFHKYYCYNSFPEKTKKPFVFSSRNNNYPKDKLPGGFILPYDMIIEPQNGTTIFEEYSFNLLKRRIISNDLGFLVNHENTYIGNKIIVRNYYEADMMFQNSFFAERFAFLIAKIICKLKREPGTDLVLIGYQQYSEYLLKAIKRIVKDKTVHIAMAISNEEAAKDKNVVDHPVNQGIASEQRQPFNIDLSFNFDIDGDNRELRERTLKSPEHFQFATIVPIGATLSTNDKIIALFKLWHKLQDPQKRESTNINFIYNHCVIIVRDTIGSEPTALEKEQQWNAIQPDQHSIKTDFRNAKEIHYTIQIARASSSADSSFGSNWLKRLNDDVSFPKEWQREKYVNFTENSSINSQNLMGFPKVDTSNCDHQEELNRLYELKNDIYKGHFDAFKSHHKYFFDTESFVRKRYNIFNKWLSDNLKFKPSFNLNNLNIIITPNAETESDLVCAVNDMIFEGNALIVYLDVKNWRNNIVHKLSFIKNIDTDSDNVKFHYVDHILLTGETYHRTKSYLYSIKGGSNPIRFHSIITLINRLPYTKGKEIKNDVDSFFAFINLYYPTSKLDGRECELCKLQRYYDDLSKKTVLDSCKQVIKKNVDKLTCKSKRELELFHNKRDTQQTNRDFLRLVMTHELYSWISDIEHQSKNDFYLTKIHVFFELDAIYHQLCYGSDIKIKKTIRPIAPKSNINNLIDDWFKSEFAEEYSDLLEYHNKKLETDKKIAFLKVISSPPLSKYIIMREYAHRKLLCVLYEIIHEKDENDYTYDDLKIVKSILKSLSFLKSNALVRKDVILGIWTVLYHVIINLEKEKSELKRIREIISIDISDTIKRINDLDKKTQKAIFDSTDINILKRKRRAANKYFYNLNCELSRISAAKDTIIKDFSRDVQFFIKNAIVEDDAKATFLGELLRKGIEMDSFDKISISKTILSKIVNNNQNEQNVLFNCFQNIKTLRNDSFDSFRKEFIHFLVWLFYDNTTIIRRTLDNITKELEKDIVFKKLFYHIDKNNYKLKSIIELKKSVFMIKEKLISKINHEYYYSSFKPYLENGDRINYVQKLIYVTYAKLKLEDLIDNKHKKRLETDIKDLLNIFSEIMGANAAFFTMKKGKNLYPISLYYQKEFLDTTWDYDNWLLSNFFTHYLYLYGRVRYPLITKYNIKNPEQYAEKRDLKNTEPEQFGEGFDLKMHSLSTYVIESAEDDSVINKNNNRRSHVNASITFLYNNTNPLINDETTFRINVQESGRLLLLLKNEIDKYVIDYLNKDRVFDIWIEKHKSSRKFEKIYANSAHVFRSVYEEMEEFDRLDEQTIREFSRTWFFLANETISFFYSNIDDINTEGEKRHFLNLVAKDVVTSETNTLGKIFNESFISILKALLESRWNENNNYQKNTIFINGHNIYQFKLDPKLYNVKVLCNKHLMRTFVALCLHNSLSLPSKHGHRGLEEIKRIDITLSLSSIMIEDHVIKEYYTAEDKDLRAKLFKKKKSYIQNMNCDEYSSTTLTTIQGVVNYINDLYERKGIHWFFDFGFNENNNFKLSLKFNDNNN